ncbi:DNA translocase FtsK [Oceanivirga miroungae]|uniref:Type VII secretion system protein EssC, FtsK/SpoIIIE family ATPase n=1 Tax=Oceanivirga miroungae TaxID=1130046 RepID=A0A6I8M7R6_9FUSO|nr:DNA translocase FtsK [Oceanivirga miroungae]VWL85530.1 type VII secretion system protein EssC, FtsK/SpoIIIE family ATPase [Oceanivirga miroungae]
MNKNNTKLQQEIKKKENKKVLRFLIGIILLVFSSFMLYVSFTPEKFIVLNNIAYKVYYVFNMLLGTSFYIFFSFLIILSIIILINKSLNYIRIIYFAIFFIIISSYKTITVIPTITNEGMIGAGRKLIEQAFEGYGAGLFGAFVSIPMYSFNNLNEYKIFIFILALLFLFLSARGIIKLFFEFIFYTFDYYDSDEYKTKKRMKEIKLEEERKAKKLKIEKEDLAYKRLIVNIVDSKLEKELKTNNNAKNEEKKIYSEKEDFENRQRWLEIINEQKEIELEKIEEEKEEKIKAKTESLVISSIKQEKIEEEKVEEKIENITKEEVEVPVPEEIKPINTFENEEEVIETNFINDEIIKTPEPEKIETENNFEKVLEREELKKSIENIFVYKKMDDSEKEKMLKYIEENIQKLEDALLSYGVEAKVVDYTTGPTVTRYEITIPSGTRVKKVTSLSDEIAMNLSAESIRFEAPIPGKNTIGIETPNKIKETVFFSNLIHSKELDKGDLNVVLGKDVVGREKIIDIAKMPHLLIAGQTGAGKSVAINTFIATLISKKSPDEVKFIMIDPKMVELMPYKDIPHLLVPVIYDPNQATIALKWAETEMDERYKKLAKLGFKKITDYNSKNENDKMPFIVVVIDELADLMMSSANSVESSIARIAQKARAVGIHLIVATQRPSTDVITGMIKANLPSRISFALPSYNDSRTILDQGGSEKLLGKGDMLLIENGSAKLERIQGAYISDDEVYKLTEVLKENMPPNYNMDILVPNEEDTNTDSLYEQALILVEEVDDKVSINMLQNNLKLGFNRARNLMNTLKENGVLDVNGYKL